MRRLISALALCAASALPAVAGEPIPLYPAPREILSPSFADEAGHELTLKDFRGKIVLLNVWATWCIPCRKEMPTLDALQARLGGKDFQVVELSIDQGGFPVIRQFFTETGIRNLTPYLGDSIRVMAGLAAFGLPTTILIDRDGRELGRLVGPAEWNSQDSVAFFQKIIAKGGN